MWKEGGATLRIVKKDMQMMYSLSSINICFFFLNVKPKSPLQFHFNQRNPPFRINKIISKEKVKYVDDQTEPNFDKVTRYNFRRRIDLGPS